MTNYFKQQGSIALKIWIYELAINSLQEVFHKEKTLRLRDSLSSLVNLLKRSGSYEDETYVKELMNKLPSKPRGYVRRGEIGPLEMKSWLIDLALDELEKQSELNIEKVEELQKWMNISAFGMLNIHVDVRVKFIHQQKRVKSLLRA